MDTRLSSGSSTKMLVLTSYLLILCHCRTTNSNQAPNICSVLSVFHFATAHLSGVYDGCSSSSSSSSDSAAPSSSNSASPCDPSDGLNGVELVFPADLGPLSWTTYFLIPDMALGGGASAAPSLLRQAQDVLKTSSDSESEPESESEYESEPESESEEVLLSNDLVTIVFDGRTGRTKRATTCLDAAVPESCLTTALDLSLGYYHAWDQGAPAERWWDGQPSGAYIFRPDGPLYPIAPNLTDANPSNALQSFEVLSGPLVSEARMVFSDWASLTLRLKAGQRAIEVEWTVGPIPTDPGPSPPQKDSRTTETGPDAWPRQARLDVDAMTWTVQPWKMLGRRPAWIDDDDVESSAAAASSPAGQPITGAARLEPDALPEDPPTPWGREVLFQVRTDIASSGRFYTDANGKELAPRIRNKRPSWKVNMTEPVAANFYPITSTIVIGEGPDVPSPPNGTVEDRRPALAVVTDRAQAASSLSDGSVEILVHRRTVLDDWRGVGENLNETECGTWTSAHFTAPCPGLTARGTFQLILTTATALEERLRFVAQRANDPLLVQVAEMGGPAAASVLALAHAQLPPSPGSDSAAPAALDDSVSLALEGSILASALPPNVHLVSMIHWPAPTSMNVTAAATWLLRFAHVFQTFDTDGYGAGFLSTSPDFAGPATVNLTALFRGLAIVDARHVSLDGLREISDLPTPFAWKEGRPLHADRQLCSGAACAADVAVGTSTTGTEDSGGGSRIVRRGRKGQGQLIRRDRRSARGAWPWYRSGWVRGAGRGGGVPAEAEWAIALRAQEVITLVVAVARTPAVDPGGGAE